MKTIPLFATFVITLVVGCVSTASTLQTAPTVGKGKVHLGAATTVPISTRFVEEIADAVTQSAKRVEAASEDQPLSEDDQRDAMESALGVLLFQPAALMVLDARYGVIDKLDVGIRWAGPGLRFDAKYWLVHKDGLDASLSAGYTRHSGIGASAAEKGFQLFETLKLASYARKDADVALLLSGAPKARIGFYGALRYIAAMVQLETSFEDIPTESEIPSGDTDSTLHHFGGTAGLRINAGPIRLLAELTVMRLSFKPTILGEETDLGGYLIEPSLGMNFSF